MFAICVPVLLNISINTCRFLLQTGMLCEEVNVNKLICIRHIQCLSEIFKVHRWAINDKS